MLAQRTLLTLAIILPLALIVSLWVAHNSIVTIILALLEVAVLLMLPNHKADEVAQM
jgi:hypothetical protein